MLETETRWSYPSPSSRSTDIEKLSTFWGTHVDSITWSRNFSHVPCLLVWHPQPLGPGSGYSLLANLALVSVCSPRYQFTAAAGPSWWAGLLQSPVQAGTVHLGWFLCPCQLSPCNLCSWVDTATDTPSSGETDTLAAWLRKPLVTEQTAGGGSFDVQSCPTLAASWTVAHQAPLSTGFPRQVYWSGLPFPSPGHLPHPGIEPTSPAFQADSLLVIHQGSP